MNLIQDKYVEYNWQHYDRLIPANKPLWNVHVITYYTYFSRFSAISPINCEQRSELWRTIFSVKFFVLWKRFFPAQWIFLKISNARFLKLFYSHKPVNQTNLTNTCFRLQQPGIPGPNRAEHFHLVSWSANICRQWQRHGATDVIWKQPEPEQL